MEATVFDAHSWLEGYMLPGVNQSSDRVRELLSARGIGRAVLMSTRAAKVDPLSGNLILRTMLENAEGLYGCLVAHINRVDVSAQAIREVLGHKRFVAALVVGTNWNEPLHPLVADEVLNACRRFQKPIYVPTPNAACVEVALDLAHRYSMHRFVFVGMGGLEWPSAIAAAHKCVNVFLETSGPLERGKVRAAVDAIGSHRVLFGSGRPHLDAAAALGLIEDSGLTENERRRVLSDNAEKLFALE